MMESVEEFRARARAWIVQNLPRIGAEGDDNPVTVKLEAEGLDSDDHVLRAKALQRIIYEGGFAGICYPEAYGGQGLTPAHMGAWNEECRGYDMGGLGLFGMTFGMIGPTILEFGTEEQKQQHVRGFLNGDNIWVQFLSEPTGGSDLAGVLTRADRDGDEWVINGSKIWTSLGDVGDYGMCVARTNWDVPKHAGISVILVPVASAGLEVQPLRLSNGSTGFCQEFFTDVRVPADHLLGNVDEGWAVASRLLVHERNSIGGGSEFWQAPPISRRPAGEDGEEGIMAAPGDLVDIARQRGKSEDSATRQLVAEAHALQKVNSQLGPRVARAMTKGVLPPPAGSMLKLFNSSAAIRRNDIEFTVAGTSTVVWEPDDGASRSRGLGFLTRQAGSILSGTTEIQKNIISERVLGLPREPSLDTKLPFREVRHNAMPTSD
jgi:alkylation response protein AidB-like acyl-CoA dehydrogenase